MLRLNKEVHKIATKVLRELEYFTRLQKDIEQLKKDCEEFQGRWHLRKDVKKEDLLRAFQDVQFIKREMLYFSQPEHDVAELLNLAVTKGVKNHDSHLGKIYDAVKKGVASPFDQHKLMIFLDRVGELVKVQRNRAGTLEAHLYEQLTQLQAIIDSGEDPFPLIEAFLKDLGEVLHWIHLVLEDSEKAEQEAGSISKHYDTRNQEFTKINRSLPKLGNTFTINGKKVTIVVRYEKNIDWNLHGQMFKECAGILQAINPNNDPETLFISKKKEQDFFKSPNIFFPKLPEIIQTLMIDLLKTNNELLVNQRMFFFVRIVGDTVNSSFNAFSEAQNSHGFDHKNIGLGLGFILAQCFFVKDFFTPPPRSFLNQCLNTPRLPQLAGRAMHILVSGSSSLYKENYRSVSYSQVLYHELTHSEDRFLRQQFVLYHVMKEDLKEKLIMQQEAAVYLDDLFLRTRLESITVFSEFFVEVKKGQYVSQALMTTFPIEETYTKLASYLDSVLQNATEIAVPSLPRAGISHHYSYEFGYHMAMVLTIDYLFTNNIDACIVPRDAFDAVGKRFPFSWHYLRDQVTQELPPTIRGSGSIDEQVYDAVKEQNIPLLIKLFESQGLTPVKKDNFKHYWKKELFLFKFDKKAALELKKKIELAGINLYVLYDKACDNLGIPSLMQTPMGKYFLAAAKIYKKNQNPKRNLPKDLDESMYS